MTDFKKLNLSATILDSLEKKGYKKPTPIQLQAIPHLLEGRDLLGIAQTGTGKTAAFSLPILDNLSKSNNPVKPNNARALILTPTRELASQIAENIEAYGQDLHLKHMVIFGGVNENPQIRTITKGVDILIATPGRLLDLINQGHIKFTNLEIFVLDEADRMLDMGFINDVKKIIKKLPEKKQTLFFSATMPQDIVSLAKLILKDPVTIEVTPQATTVDKIDQKIHFVDKSNKQLLLKSIIVREEVTSVLVFSKTKHGANKVVEYLVRESIKVAAIHGNKSQAAREKALNDFRSGTIKVLVATDIAARGIDVPGISHVINYDIPNDPENYVHRIGRTARAGKEGVAISFCDPSERKLLAAVEKLIKISVPIDRTHPYHGAAPRVMPKFSGAPKTSEDYANKPRSRIGGDYSRSNEDRRKGSFRNETPRERKFNAPTSTERKFDAQPRERSLYSRAGEDRKSSFRNDAPRDRKFFDNFEPRDRKFNSAEPRQRSFNSKTSADGNRKFNSDKPERSASYSSREKSEYSSARTDGNRRRFNSDKPAGERSNFGSRERTNSGNEYSRSGENNRGNFGNSSSYKGSPKPRSGSGGFNSGGGRFGGKKKPIR